MQYCHEWKIEEDKFCCRIYMWYMFTKLPKTKEQEENIITFSEYQEMLSVVNPRELITMIWKQYPFITEKEILFQIRKIKQISMEISGGDHVPIIPSPNYRKQLKDAFYIVMEEIGCQLRHEPPPKTREEIWAERQEYMKEYTKKYGKLIISREPNDYWK